MAGNIEHNPLSERNDGMAASPKHSPSNPPAIFRSLRHRNFRLFFGGQLVSLVGSFLTLTATSWLVLRLTHSAKMLGLVAFSGQIGLFVLTPLTGVWVDRLNRRRLLVVTQTLAMIQSFMLAGLALGHVITVGEIIALNLFQSVINSFDIPARQAFMIEMVDDRDDLANAIALNSIMVHGARLIGPAIAGLLIAFVGEGVCFAIDGISYIGVILALIAMNVAPRPPRLARSVITEFKEGLAYIWHFLPIRVLLILMAVISLTGMPALSVLMPIYAAHFEGTSRAGAAAFGLLGAATGLGALAGSFQLASRKSVRGLGMLIATAAAMFAVALTAFAFSPHLWISLLIVPVAGWAMISLFASCNTILQTVTDDDKRGRVMSFFAMAFVGMSPFGNLLAGYMATKLTPAGADAAAGASRTLLIEALVCLAAAGGFLRALPRLREIIRPIYIQKGLIIPAEMTLPPTMEAAEQ
jgi:MFS family permease